MWDYMLTRVETAGGGTARHLRLGLMRKPKPVLAQ